MEITAEMTRSTGDVAQTPKEAVETSDEISRIGMEDFLQWHCLLLENEEIEGVGVKGAEVGSEEK